jgi:hypothetical protein
MVVSSRRTAAQSCVADAIRFDRVSGHAEINVVAASRHPLAARAYALAEAVRMVAGSVNDPPIDDARLLSKRLSLIADGAPDSGAGSGFAGVGGDGAGGSSRIGSGGSSSSSTSSGGGGGADAGAGGDASRVLANVGGCVAFRSGRNSELVIVAKQPPKAAVLKG